MGRKAQDEAAPRMETPRHQYSVPAATKAAPRSPNVMAHRAEIESGGRMAALLSVSVSVLFFPEQQVYHPLRGL